MLALIAQTDYSSDAAAAAAATGVFGGLLLFWTIFWIVFGIVYLAFLIWWIILIIDLAKRDFPEKNTWLIIMIVGVVIPAFMWLADLLYYFMVVKKYGKAGGSAPSAPAAPAPK